MTSQFDEREDRSGMLQTLTATASSIAQAAADFIGAWIDRIINGIKGIAVSSLFCAGCQSAADLSPPPPPQVSELTQPTESTDAMQAEDGPHQLGLFTITFYYVVNEEEVAKPIEVANDKDAETQLGAITPPELVTLYAKDKQCEPIAEVSKEFASQLAIQGTGKLRDGRVLNIWGHCDCEHTPCFRVTETQWGTGGSGRSLQPFRTVAVDPKVVKLGSLLYVPLLEGRTMPGRAPWGGYVHDGCVVADDTGGHIGGNRLDLFVGRKAYFFGLIGSAHNGGSHAWARHVPVYDGTGICERKGRHVGRKSASI